MAVAVAVDEGGSGGRRKNGENWMSIEGVMTSIDYSGSDMWQWQWMAVAVAVGVDGSGGVTGEKNGRNWMNIEGVMTSID
jgi:hypothetical protein